MSLYWNVGASRDGSAAAFAPDGRFGEPRRSLRRTREAGHYEQRRDECDERKENEEAGKS